MKPVNIKGWFAHDARDSALVTLAVLQFSLLMYGVLSFGQIAPWKSVVLGAVSALLICTNFQCIAHNFIHNPFFARKTANRAFSIFNSILIGGPQTLYRLHHLNHHRYNNDLPDPVDGKAKDATSTWQHGHPPVQEENFLKYALLGYFRTDFGSLFAAAKRKHLGRLAFLECIALSLFLIFLFIANWRGAVYFYLPVWVLGNVLAVAENYFEHYGATPGDRRADSVSSYGRLYNVLWFNNGYHQEHHFKPQVHWTRIAEVKGQLPPESERRVVKGAHFFNFGKRKPLQQAPTASGGARHLAHDRR